ncbi:MAG: hypothetical protein HN891_03330 [Planctomycetes bacterium]|jgi:hypothetical protein|nr:hypothetical protein [Planctomycetota bacterium]MBT6452857.1 hypothetical protein [Planctomycetota bacterium]MBT6541609.1 hypothetical protein [Planctomycetota bacterium]MBT6783443.1 hypothetical protein [Planctomycetota bacterium]MBT6967528.1 hypothetical protein [Planctomycetota bacterium]
MYDQPIVERKDASPLATSLLAISVVCLILASTLLGMRLRELTIPGKTATTSAKSWENTALKHTTDKANALLAGVELPDEG